MFLSYSRRDTAFVDELIISLESYGFEILLDREDLFPGEQWEPRLHRFISEADTTVCVVSANWVASQQCVKELKIALDQGRRVIPVVIDHIHPDQMPPELARLQFVFFSGDGRSYARGVVNLVDALRTDIEWVREQSRLLDKAQEWAANGKSGVLVLRGAALERALEWIDAPRPEQTRILPVVAEFVEASRREGDDEEKRRLRGRFWFASVTGLALVGLLSSGLLAMETFRRAAEARASEQERQVLAEQLRARELDRELTQAVFELNQEDDAPLRSEVEATPGDAGAGAPDISTGAGADAPLPEQPQDRGDDSLVAQLNAADKTTRVQAGQRVVDAIRSPDNAQVLADLVRQLEPSTYNALSSSGRFNVLYMLNVHDDWRGAPAAAELAVALQRLEAMGLGSQSQDCVDQLQAKLAGQAGASDRCGGR